MFCKSIYLLFTMCPRSGGCSTALPVLLRRKQAPPESHLWRK